MTLSVETTYLGGFILFVPALFPSGLSPGGALSRGQSFSANTIKLAKLFVQNDINSKNTHITYLGAMLVTEREEV